MMCISLSLYIYIHMHITYTHIHYMSIISVLSVQVLPGLLGRAHVGDHGLHLLDYSLGD